MVALIIRWGTLLTLMNVLLMWFPRLLTSNQPIGNGTGILAYGSGSASHSQIYLHDIAEDNITQLTIESAGYYGIDWSPDGNFLAYSRTGTRDREHGVYIQEINTGIMQRLNREGYPNLVSWSQDGCCLAYVTTFRDAKPYYEGTRLAVYDLQTEVETVMDTGRVSRIHPIWSRDGGQLLFSYSLNDSLSFAVFTLGSDTGVFSPLVRANEGHVEGLAWSPDNNRILLSVLHEDRSKSLMLYDVQCECSTSLFHDDNWYVAADWSPDGRYIALSNSGDNSNLAGQIELIDIERRLRVFLAEGFTPAWQPIPQS